MTTAANGEGGETTQPWWLVLLEGIFAALFGALLLIAPGGTLVFLVQVLGFFLLIGGILRLVSIFLDHSLWGLKLAVGILGILAGIVVLNHPLWSASAIPTYTVYIVGFLAIFEGIGTLIQAFEGSGWGALILGNLLIIFGIILLFNAWIGVAVLPFVLGGVMLAGGVAAIVVSFRLAPPTNEDPVAQSFKAWCDRQGDYVYDRNKGTETCTRYADDRVLTFSEEPTITVLLTRDHVYTREGGQTTESWTPWVVAECYYNRDYTTYDRDPLPLDDPRCFVPPEYQ